MKATAVTIRIWQLPVLLRYSGQQWVVSAKVRGSLGTVVLSLTTGQKVECTKLHLAHNLHNANSKLDDWHQPRPLVPSSCVVPFLYRYLRRVLKGAIWNTTSEENNKQVLKPNHLKWSYVSSCGTIALFQRCTAPPCPTTTPGCLVRTVRWEAWWPSHASWDTTDLDVHTSLRKFWLVSQLSTGTRRLRVASVRQSV